MRPVRVGNPKKSLTERVAGSDFLQVANGKRPSVFGFRLKNAKQRNKTNRGKREKIKTNVNSHWQINCLEQLEHLNTKLAQILELD